MLRWLPTLAGAALAATGFALALISLALPWASYRVTADLAGQPAGDTGALDRSGGIAVFQLHGGGWYVTLLLAVLGLLLGAAMGTGWTARASGTAALGSAVAAMLVATALRNGAGSAAAEVASMLGTVGLRVSAGPGSAYGLAALPLLGLGAAVLSTRTPVPVAGRGRTASGPGASAIDAGKPAGTGAERS